MNRFIYVLGMRGRRRPLRSAPLSEVEKKEVEEIIAFLKALADRTSITMLEMTREAKQVYDSFEEEIENRIAEQDLGLKEGYCGQLPNLAVRLSCLFRLSRMTPDEIRSHQEAVLSVEKQDVERAIEYVLKTWEWFGKVIEIMQTSSSETGKSLLAKESMVDLLREKQLMHGRQMCRTTARQIGCSIATAYNARKELEKAGKLCFPKYGYLKLKEDCSKCRYKNTCSHCKLEGGD